MHAWLSHTTAARSTSSTLPFTGVWDKARAVFTRGPLSDSPYCRCHDILRSDGGLLNLLQRTVDLFLRTRIIALMRHLTAAHGSRDENGGNLGYPIPGAHPHMTTWRTTISGDAA